MILTDFQRGRLPYFVAPPRPDGAAPTKETPKTQSIKFVPASIDGETAKDGTNEKLKGEEIAQTEGAMRRVPGVKQDLTGIHVEPDFIDEDEQGIDGDADGVEIEGEVEEDAELMEEEEELSENEDVGDADKGDTISEKEAEETEVNDNTGNAKETGSKHILKSQKFEQSNVDNGAEISTELEGETMSSKSVKKAKSKKTKAGYQDGEVSFKVLQAETESSCCSEGENEEAGDDPIEKIKKKVENENEEQILSSLTPEEKSFLGIDDESREDGR